MVLPKELSIERNWVNEMWFTYRKVELKFDQSTKNKKSQVKMKYRETITECVFPLSSLWAWPIFQCQIPFLYLVCICLLFVSRSPGLFSFFWKDLYIHHLHKGINILLWFSKFVAPIAFSKYCWMISLLLRIVWWKRAPLEDAFQEFYFW